MFGSMLEPSGLPKHTPYFAVPAITVSMPVWIEVGIPTPWTIMVFTESVVLLLHRVIRWEDLNGVALLPELTVRYVKDRPIWKPVP